LSNPKQLLVIAGPTASGKTQLAIDLAKQYNAAVLNADSRQVYAELQIGTARPTQEEMQGVAHHLFGHISIHQDYNASRYAQEAAGTLQRLFVGFDTLVLCGGTGLYIQALLEGLDDLPEANLELRKELEAKLEAEGIETLIRTLDALDPERAAKTDRKNPRRVIRAIEIASQQLDSNSNTRNSLLDSAWEVKGYYLDPNRELLYEHINSRVDSMLENGLENEAEFVYPFKSLKALQTVGYTELFRYFDGEWTRDFAIEKIKQHTRNYAKRQLTWFRNKTDFTPIQGIEGL